MAPKNDLIKLFGVEHLITRKTLYTETKTDVMRKTPHDMTLDVKAILDEMNYRAATGDLDGIEECIKASQLRLECMQDVVTQIKNARGKGK